MNLVCTQCGFENPLNFKFCGNCGTSLAPMPITFVVPETRQRAANPIPQALAEKISRVGKQIEGERRTVTVLFSDISGYTAISEKLDPEQVYELIDTTLKAFTDQIYKHEGVLDKVMGDGLMALFGAPIAHEDDPARAVRAALGMQDALKRINEDLETRLGISLRVRIGLNAGTVVVGSIGSDLRMEYTALGDTVNVASRLQTAAEPGTILVSRSVYEPTKPIFDFRELGSIRVKNRIEPVEIFEALAPRHKAGRVRGIPGLSAPMVGRQEEFARVRQIVDELASRQRGGIALVTGNAGIGKSRLTTELKGYLSNKSARVLEGACLAYGQPTYGVFLQILKSLFGLADDDLEEITRDKIERTIKAALPADIAVAAVLPYIAQLFSLRIFEKEMAARMRHLTPPQLQQQTFIAIRELIVATAQQQPCVIIFEDIHWIDSISLELLTFLLSCVETTPLLIYCNSRPAEGTAAPQILRLGNEMYAEYFLHVPLAPLSHADSVALIDLLLTIHELPGPLKQIIPQRAEGNPFYLEEIIRMMIDRGIIYRHGDRWAMAPGADLNNLQVPTTLQGLIMARVDNLGDGTRQVAQCAAVIGRDFSYRLLACVIEGTRTLADDLQELEERQLISHIDGDNESEYRFNHILIQETIYQSLLVRRREHLHRKIAEGIETLYKDRTEERVEALAFHYSQSQDLERALPYQIRAGRHDEHSFANDQALKHYQIAADFLTRMHPSSQQRIDVYTGLGAVQNFIGDYAGSTTSYLIALEVVRAGGKSIVTSRTSAEIMRAIGRVCERRGDYVEALRWLDNALRELESDPDQKSGERVRIFNDIGWVQYRRGEFDQAYDWRMKTLQIVEGTEQYNEMASAYNGLVALFTRKGDWERAVAYAQKGLQLREMIGDLRAQSQSYTNLGVIAWEQGKWDQTLDYLERSLAIKQKIGDVEGIALLNNNLGEINREKGNYVQATELVQKALDVADKIKNRNTMCLALNNLANVKILQGDYPSAAALLTRSHRVATEIGSKEQRAEAQWLLAEAQFGLGQLGASTEFAQQALALASEIGRKLIEGKVLRTLAKIARAQQNLSVADDTVHQSIAIFTGLKNPFELAKSQHQLALLQRAQGQESSARATLAQARDTFARLGAAAELARAQTELAQLPESA